MAGWPSLGGLNISAGFVYNPSGLDGEPSKQSISKSSLIFGANTGITWNFSRLMNGNHIFFDSHYGLCYGLEALKSEILIFQE